MKEAPAQEAPARSLGTLVYAIIILLAFLAALEQRALPPWESIAAVWITLLGTALAEAYSRWLAFRLPFSRLDEGADGRTHDQATRRAVLREALVESLAFAVPGVPVTIVYLLEWLGVERASQANSIANGVLLGMLFMLGFGARWTRRTSFSRALAEGTLVACVGTLVVAVKLVLH